MSHTSLLFSIMEGIMDPQLFIFQILFDIVTFANRLLPYPEHSNTNQVLHQSPNKHN